MRWWKKVLGIKMSEIQFKGEKKKTLSDCILYIFNWGIGENKLA